MMKLFRFLKFLHKNEEKIVKIIENYDKINVEKPKKRYSLYGVPLDQMDSIQEILKEEVK